MRLLSLHYMGKEFVLFCFEVSHYFGGGEGGRRPSRGENKIGSLWGSRGRGRLSRGAVLLLLVLLQSCLRGLRNDGLEDRVCWVRLV